LCRSDESIRMPSRKYKSDIRLKEQRFMKNSGQRCPGSCSKNTYGSLASQSYCAAGRTRRGPGMDKAAENPGTRECSGILSLQWLRPLPKPRGGRVRRRVTTRQWPCGSRGTGLVILRDEQATAQTCRDGAAQAYHGADVSHHHYRVFRSALPNRPTPRNGPPRYPGAGRWPLRFR